MGGRLMGRSRSVAALLATLAAESFQDLIKASATSDPTVSSDNDGARYYNTTSKKFMVYDHATLTWNQVGGGETESEVLTTATSMAIALG